MFIRCQAGCDVVATNFLGFPTRIKEAAPTQRDMPLAILVQSETGWAHWELDASTTIVALKRLICTRNHADIDDVWLQCGSKPLEDARSLEDYNLQQYATVHVLARARGGGCAPSKPQRLQPDGTHRGKPPTAVTQLVAPNYDMAEQSTFLAKRAAGAASAASAAGAAQPAIASREFTQSAGPAPSSGAPPVAAGPAAPREFGDLFAKAAAAEGSPASAAGVSCLVRATERSSAGTRTHLAASLSSKWEETRRARKSDRQSQAREQGAGSRLLDVVANRLSGRATDAFGSFRAADRQTAARRWMPQTASRYRGNFRPSVVSRRSDSSDGDMDDSFAGSFKTVPSNSASPQPSPNGTSDAVDELGAEGALSEKDVEILLTRVPQLASMPFSLRRQVLRSFAPREYESGSTVVRKGDKLDTFFYVSHGCFCTYLCRAGEEEGEVEKVLLERCTAGAVMGQRALHHVHSSELQIECEESGTVQCITGKTFIKFNEEGGDLSGANDELTTQQFLRRLASTRGVRSTTLQAIAEKVTEHTADTSAAVTDTLTRGAMNGAMMIVKAGALSLSLPRPKELSGHGHQREPRFISLRAGDMLSPVALAWFVEAQAISREQNETGRDKVRQELLAARTSMESKRQTATPEASGSSTVSVSSLTPSAPRKSVHWGKLPTPDDYVAAGYERHGKRAAVSSTSGVVLLELPVTTVQDKAASVLIEAQVGLASPSPHCDSPCRPSPMASPRRSRELAPSTAYRDALAGRSARSGAR